MVSETTGNCELHPGSLGRYQGVYVLYKQITLYTSDSFYTLGVNQEQADQRCSVFLLALWRKVKIHFFLFAVISIELAVLNIDSDH